MPIQQIENKKNENFLESTATTTTEIIDHTNVFSVITDADVTADNAPKSCEIQNSVKDDEVMLYENVGTQIKRMKQLQKSCTLACYKDGEWNTPVPVVLQLLEKKTKESKRIVCHQIGTGRLQLNSTMLPTMTMKKLKTKSIIFVGQLISDEATLAPHRVIFQDQTQRDIFLKHF
ncbi:hypothetical protein X943_000965 [Babesia divergens]|uniref:Uncharacterized protein n=1 Tax=Babesia divergens TaxID=32595 RepID=A0AAD9GF94_BABDI|nr:hypothetical protein X943_000965 [Babesia divergens]